MGSQEGAGAPWRQQTSATGSKRRTFRHQLSFLGGSNTVKMMTPRRRGVRPARSGPGNTTKTENVAGWKYWNRKGDPVETRTGLRTHRRDRHPLQYRSEFHSCLVICSGRRTCFLRTRPAYRGIAAWACQRQIRRHISSLPGGIYLVSQGIKPKLQPAGADLKEGWQSGRMHRS